MLRSPELAYDYRDFTDDELLRVCGDLRNADAWEEFIRRFHGPIHTAIWRAGRRYAKFQQHMYDDLEQDTYFRLSAGGARALRDFVPRRPGSAIAYLQVIAMRVTLDYCKRKDFRRLQELPPAAADVPAPERTHWLARLSEVNSLLDQQAAPRDRQIFRLCHVQGLTAREIAAIECFGLSVKGVESALARLRKVIQENFGDR